MSTATASREEFFQQIAEMPPGQREKAALLAGRIFRTRYQYFANKPVEFINNVLGDFVWSKQIEIVESVRDHRRTAVHACHDTGKSFIAGRIVPWFVMAVAAGDAIVVTTAPTMRQVKNILWKEIREAVRNGDLPGDLNLTEWKIQNADGLDILAAFGQKPADWDPAAFQGIHRLKVLVILDEACGIPEAIFDAAASLVTNEESRILAIGNPDDPTSKFARVCRPGSGWHVIHIGWRHTPNHPDSTEEIPERLSKHLISQLWVEEMADPRTGWGTKSPKYTSKVLGLFPEDAADGVVPLSLLMRCTAPPDYPEDHYFPVELGVDVGAGGDETNIRERRGRMVGRVWRGHDPDTMVSAQLVLDVIEETGATSVKVDVIGIGKGLTDRLKQWKREGLHGAEIYGVNVGEGAISPTEHQNLRCQIWWDIGRGLSQEMIWNFSGLEGADRDTLFGQLVAVKSRPPDGSGRNRIEPKSATKTVIGRSPDDADALLLAYYVPPPEEVHYLTTPEMKQISPV